jgi:hypothetical protein
MSRSRGADIGKHVQGDAAVPNDYKASLSLLDIVDSSRLRRTVIPAVIRLLSVLVEKAAFSASHRTDRTIADADNLRMADNTLRAAPFPRSPFERSLSGRRFRVLGVGSVPVSG